MDDCPPHSLPAVLTPWPTAKSGKFRVLAITDSKRSKDFPDVPTMAEAGLGDAVVAPWFAVLVPRARRLRSHFRIEGTIRDAVASPDVASRFQAAGAVPVFQTGTQARAMIRQEISRWQELAKTTSLKAQADDSIQLSSPRTFRTKDRSRVCACSTLPPSSQRHSRPHYWLTTAQTS